MVIGTIVNTIPNSNPRNVIPKIATAVVPIIS